jgi:hypothetical protein
MMPKSPPPDLPDDSDADFVAICSLDYKIAFDRRNRERMVKNDQLARKAPTTATSAAPMPAHAADRDETDVTFAR